MTFVDDGMIRIQADKVVARIWHTALVAAAICTAMVGSEKSLADEHERVVRLASVNAPAQAGLLSHLLEPFEAETGYRVEVHGSSDPYGRARAGQADLVLSHYGKAGVESFVRSGMGLWPRMVFSNQMVLIGPADDPAGIADMADPVAAMRRIVERKAPFVIGPGAGTRYLSDLLLAAVGNPDLDDWPIRVTQARAQMIKAAERHGGYVLWGAFPFARYQSRNGGNMHVMVHQSPLLHRVMATVRVNPEQVEGINAEGAAALEAYLLSPAAQATVLAFRETGQSAQTWWPAARENAAAALMKGAVNIDDDS